MNEWTPEAVKAEIDYRREHALRDRLRTSGQPSWLYRVTHRTTVPKQGKEHRDAA